MEQENQPNATSYIKDIKRRTKRRFTSEEKIGSVLMGLRGEAPISEICRQLGIVQSLYYKWSKDFLEAGKQRLSGDTLREANTTEVRQLRSEAEELTKIIGQQTLRIERLKKSLNGNI